MGKYDLQELMVNILDIVIIWASYCFVKPGLPTPHRARTQRQQEQDLPAQLSQARCSQTCLDKDMINMSPIWDVKHDSYLEHWTWFLFGTLNMIPIWNVEHDFYLECWWSYMILIWNKKVFLASFLHEILNSCNAVVLHRTAETSIPDTR